MIIEYDTRINLAMVAHASCFIFFLNGERRAGGSNNKNKASGIAPNGTQFKLKLGTTTTNSQKKIFLLGKTVSLIIFY